jgi:hypothetical protein
MSGHRVNRLYMVLTVVLGSALLLPAQPLTAASQIPDQVLAWNLHAYNGLILGQGSFSIRRMAAVRRRAGRQQLQVAR